MPSMAILANPRIECNGQASSSERKQAGDNDEDDDDEQMIEGELTGCLIVGELDKLAFVSN